MNSNQPADRDALRRRAAAELKKRGFEPAVETSAADTARMLHELQVHQIELEMQNEELRNAQTEVEAASARYADLYDFAPVGYFTLDADGAITQVNLAGAELLGLERAGVLRKRFGVFLAAADVRAFNACRQQAVAAPGNPSSCEVAIESRGQLRQSRLKAPLRTVHLAATFSANGRELRVVVMDITEHKLAEEALRRSEERLRLALAAAHLGTFDWQIPENRIVWSPEHEAMWGFKPGEFGGTSEAFAARVHPDDLPGIDAELARCIAGRVPFQHEFRVVWPDGSRHWIFCRGEFKFAADEQPQRMHGAVVDVTERKAAETAMADQLAELQRWEHVTLGREARVQELKREVNARLAQLHQPPRYASEVAAAPGQPSS